MSQFQRASDTWSALVRTAAEDPRLGFTTSSRRHRIGRARIRAALIEPSRIFMELSHRQDGRFLMVVGADEGGRLLEIGLIVKDNGEALVIHAMDARPKWRQHDSEGS